MVERSAKRRDLTLDKVVEAALAILRTEDEARADHAARGA